MLSWFIANRLLAGWTVGVPSRGVAPVVDRVVDELAPGARDRVRSGPGTVPPDVEIVAGGSAGEVRRERLVLPGCDCPWPGPPTIWLGWGDPPSELLLVPGSGHWVRGRYRLDPQAVDRLRRAERTPRSSEPESGRIVLLSGWSGEGGGLGPTEAEMLLDQVGGGRSNPLLDPAARTTADNALFACALAAAFDPPLRIVAFGSWSNALRFRLLLLWAGREYGVSTELTTVRGRGHGRYLRPGVTGLAFMNRHLAQGRDRLESALGPGRPAREARR